MKLLIIEDEVALLDTITKYFKRAKCVCETASTYKEGLRKLQFYEYDCVIVDLNLPGGDGLGLVKYLKEENSETGIVIISARNTLNDKLKGLDLGADDYLVKPFHLSELNARIKAVVRRKSDKGNTQMKFNEIVIDTNGRSVFINEQPVKLTKKEYDILIYLVRNKNRVVTKDSIAERLWGDYMDEAVSFDFIYSHVKNLRKKLIKNGCTDYLKTVYGIGYKFSDY